MSWRSRKIEGQGVAELTADLAGKRDEEGKDHVNCFNGFLPLDRALKDFPPASTNNLEATQGLFDKRVIISCDPGVVNSLGLVMSLGTVTETSYVAKFTKRLVSTKSVYSTIGTDDYLRERQSQLPDTVSYAQEQLSLRHPRDMLPASYDEYVTTFNAQATVIHANSMESLPKKASLYSRKQRFKDNFVNDLNAQVKALHDYMKIPMVKKPVIVLGSGAMPSMKGKKSSFAGPLMKHLKRHFLIITLDEYNTSQKCPKCLGRLSALNGTHRVKKCTKARCRPESHPEFEFKVNRDVSAPVNNINILLHFLKFGKRPPAFARPQRRIVVS